MRIRRFISIFCIMCLIITGCTKVTENLEQQESVAVVHSSDEMMSDNNSDFSDQKIDLLETQISLPWENENCIRGFFEKEDGTWVVYGMTGNLCVSFDKGKTWKSEPRKEVTEWIKEKSKIENYNYSNTRMSAKGNELTWSVSFERSDDDFRVEDFFGKQTVHYLFQKSTGEKKEGILHFSENEYLFDAWLGVEGEVFYRSGIGLYELDADSGKSKLLFELDEFQNAYIKNNVLIAWSKDKLYLYDYAKKESIPSYPILEDFIKREMGNVVLGNGESNAIYIMADSGLYRYILGGTSIEKICNEKTMTIRFEGLGRSEIVESPAPGVFISSVMQTELYLYQGVETKAEDTKVLKLYRLREERYDISTIYNDLEVAIRKYEKLNPNIKIEIELGMPPAQEESAVVVQDVIKQLNLELAAKQGADILLLDNLPAESYIEKGLLADISEVVNSVNQKEGLLPQILKHYKEDGKIYQIPLGFTTNVVWMPEEYIKESQTLEGLSKMSQHSGEEKNKGWEVLLASICGIGGYAEPLAPSCMKAWINTNGAINTKALEEFYTQIGLIAQVQEENSANMLGYQNEKINNPELTEIEWIKQKEGGLEKIKIYRDTKNSDLKDPGILITNSNAISGVGEVGSEIGGLYLPEVKRVTEKTSKWNMDFEIFLGQQGKNVFNPKRIVAINQNSKNMDEAKKFLEFLLSEACNYGIQGFEAIREEKGETIKEVGRPLFPINQKILQEDFESFNVTKEQIKKIENMIDTLEEPSLRNDILLDMVIEEGAQVIWKDKTPAQAAQDVEKHMEIYLMEVEK